MMETSADALMSTEADAVCGVTYRQISDECVNHRNGYHSREWDTSVATVEPWPSPC